MFILTPYVTGTGLAREGEYGIYFQSKTLTGDKSVLTAEAPSTTRSIPTSCGDLVLPICLPDLGDYFQPFFRVFAPSYVQYKTDYLLFRLPYDNTGGRFKKTSLPP